MQLRPHEQTKPVRMLVSKDGPLLVCVHWPCCMERREWQDGYSVGCRTCGCFEPPFHQHSAEGRRRRKASKRLRGWLKSLPTWAQGDGVRSWAGLFVGPVRCCIVNYGLSGLHIPGGDHNMILGLMRLLRLLLTGKNCKARADAVFWVLMSASSGAFNLWIS